MLHGRGSVICQDLLLVRESGAWSRAESSLMWLEGRVCVCEVGDRAWTTLTLERSAEVRLLWPLFLL